MLAFEAYFKIRGRFPSLTPETVAEIEHRVRNEYVKVKKKCR